MLILRRAYLLFFIVLLPLFAANEEITLRLKWHHQFQFAGYYMAKHKGLYEKAGLHVTIQEVNPKESYIDFLKNTPSSYAIMDSSGLLQRLKGAPIITLGAIFQYSPNVLLTLKSSGIKDFSDLKGRKVMANLDDQDASILIAIQESGLTKNDFNLQPFSYDYNDLLSGRTDIMSAYITDEPYMLQKKGIAYTILDPLAYGINFYGDMIYTSEEEVQRNPQRAKKFLEASIAGWEYALKNIDETVALIQREYKPSLPKDQLLFEAGMIKQMVLAERIPIGQVSQTRINEIAHYYSKLGFVSNIQRAKDFIFGNSKVHSLTQGFEASLTEEEKAYLKSNRNFTIGFIEEYPPFSYINDKAERAGIIIDTINALDEYTAIKLIPKPMPWSEVMQSIKNRTIDLFFGQENEERKAFSNFTSPVSSFSYAAFSHNPYERVNTFEGLKNKKVLSIQGFAINEVLKTIPGIELILKKNTLEAIESLMRKEADFFIDNLLATNYFIKTYSFTGIYLSGILQEKEQHSKLGVRNDNALLYSILQKAVNFIPKERFDAIQNRWILQEYAKNEQKNMPLSVEERQWISQNPIISVANDPSYQPFDFYENEQATGFSIELFERICKAIGITPVFVTKDWDSLLNEFKQGKIHVLTSVNPTTESKEYANYSKPYIKNIQVIASGKNVSEMNSLKDFEGKRLAIPNGYEILSELKDANISIIHIPAQDILDALRLVALGKADFTVEALPLIDYYSTRYGITNLKFHSLAKHMSTKDFHFGVQKKETILLNLINKALDTIAQEEILKLQRKWFTTKNYTDSDTINLTEEEKLWLLEHPILKVANDSEWAPYDFVQNGKASGYSVELLSMIGKTLGVSFKFISGDNWKELLEAFKNKEIDLLHATVKTPQREKYTHFGEPYILASTVLVKPVGSPKLNSLEEAVAQYSTIGVVKGHWTNEIILKEFPSLHVEAYSTIYEGLKALNEGKIPLFLGTEQPIRYMANRHQIQNIELSPLNTFKNSDYEQLRFGVHLENPILQTILHKALNAMPNEEIVALQRKWFGDVLKDNRPTKVVYNEEEIAFMKKHPTLRIGADTYFPPYDFKSSDGMHQGLAKDILSFIMKDFEAVVFKEHYEKNTKENEQKIQEKNLDLLLSISPIKTQTDMLLSIPYIEIPYMLFGTSESNFVDSLSELKGESIGYVEKSHDRKQLQKLYPNIEFVPFASGKEMIEAINLKVIKYFLASLPSTNYVMKSQGITSIKLLGKTDEMFRLSFAVRSDWPELVSIINKGLRAMNEGEKNKIYDNWFRVEVKPITDYSLLWKAVSLFSFLLLVFLYWNRKLSLEIKRRKETEEKLILAQQHAESANRAKSEFLSNMSHEIRTPMNAVIGFAELTSKMELPKIAQQNIHTILRSAKALIAIINDILDLSKIEAGKLKVQKEPIDIRELADELQNIFYVKVQEKGLEFKIDFSDTIPNALFIDEIRIRQILLNLVGNAIKFTEKGKIHISFNAVANPSHDSTMDLHVSVHDSGIGINPEDREKVFELFEQQSGQDNRKFGGTGLGLAISQKLANLMGGEITLQSPLEGGSIFTLLLYHVEIASSNPKMDKAKVVTKHFAQELVLAIDDIEDNLSLITTLLEEYGFKVISASDAEEGIQLAIKHLPKLIFMDIKMPKMDGYEATDILKHTTKTHDIPIIAVSASVIGEREEAMQRGLFDAFVSKPINIKELEDTIALFVPYTTLKPLVESDHQSISYTLTLPENERISFIEQLELILKQGNINAISEMIALMESQKSIDSVLIEKLNNALLTFDLQQIETILGNIISQAKQGYPNV